jgi:hypothetical protein
LQKGGKDSPSIELTSLDHSFFILPAIIDITNGDVSMKDSFCGLCEDCHLGNQDFHEAIEKVISYVSNLPLHWWEHCFRGDPGFSFAEFRKGLMWFLDHPECPGCKNGGGFDQCPIRLCANQRQHAHCYECPDVETCKHIAVIFQRYPEPKVKMLRHLFINKKEKSHSPGENE